MPATDVPQTLLGLKPDPKGPRLISAEEWREKTVDWRAEIEKKAWYERFEMFESNTKKTLQDLDKRLQDNLNALHDANNNYDKAVEKGASTLTRIATGYQHRVQTEPIDISKFWAATNKLSGERQKIQDSSEAVKTAFQLTAKTFGLLDNAKSPKPNEEVMKNLRTGIAAGHLQLSDVASTLARNSRDILFKMTQAAQQNRERPVEQRTPTRTQALAQRLAAAHGRQQEPAQAKQRPGSPKRSQTPTHSAGPHGRGLIPGG
jgi:hypothetical protein